MKIMKIRNTLFLLTLVCFFSCSAIYTSSNHSETKTIIENANFKNLGFFVGVATIPKKTATMKQREAVQSQAKKNMITAAGTAYQTGKPQIFINTKIEFLENKKNIICTFSGDLIEFEK